MSLTINATMSDEFANSYVDVAYGDAYWSSHYSAAKMAQWQNLSSSAKVVLLIHACRVLESKRFVYDDDRRGAHIGRKWRYDRSLDSMVELVDESRPERARYNQSLQFPRNIDRNTSSGAFYIPEPVKLAQCEQAMFLYTYDDSAAASQLSGLIKDQVQVGEIKVSQEYSEGKVPTAFCPTAMELLKPYMLRAGTVIKRA